jgi:hypothetical protein
VYYSVEIIVCKLGIIIHACNTRYLRGRDRVAVCIWPREKNARLYLKNTFKKGKGAGGMAQSGRRWPTKHKNLS